MKKLIVVIIAISNLVVYSQWNNGSIAFNQVRANIEFIDSNNLLIAGGHTWSAGGTNVNITQLAHLYEISSKQSSLLSMNTPRLEPIMVRGDSGIYIIGGVSNWADVNGNGWLVENTMEIYKNGSFTEVSIPFSTFDGHAVALNGKIIVAGGLKYWKWYQSAADVVGETDLWIYDEASMTWSSRPSTDNRFYSSAVTVGDIAIFAGGLVMNSSPSSILDGFSLSDAYEIYDSQTDTWSTGTLPTNGARAKISACHCDGYFVFVGGALNDNIASSRIDIYDGSNWTTQNLVSSARAVEDCAVAGNKILFAGGLSHDLNFHHGGSFIFGTVNIFNPQTQSFTQTNLTRPLMDFRMASYGRRAAASPGVSYPGSVYTAYNEVQVYEDLSWVNSISENTNEKVVIYPNPTNDKISVSVENNNGLVKTEIFDIIGNRLLVSTENIISIQHFSNGVYVVKVTHNNEVSEFKVIKE